MGAFETVMSNLGPYAWAKFNETGTANFANSGTQGGNWARQGVWTLGQTGIDGTNAASTPTGQIYVNLDGFRAQNSFVMWFKRVGGTNTAGRNLIEAYVSSSYNMDSVGECGINTSGYVQFGPRYNTAATSMTSNVNVLDGNWHHIAFTRDNTTAKIYIDGNLTNTGTVGSGVNTTAATFYIGLATGDGTNYYDEVAYFQKTLTAAEVASLYSGSTATNITITDTAGMSVSNSTFPDPVIDLQSNVQYTADPSTADSDIYGPSVTADSSVNYAADPSTASSEALDPTVDVTGNVEHTDTAWTASAEMLDPTISVQVAVSIAADPMTASSLSPANIFYGQTTEDTTYTLLVRQISGSFSNNAVTTSFTIGTDNAGAGTKVSLALKPNSGFPPANNVVKAKFHPTQVTASTASDSGGDNTFNIYVFTADPGSNFQSMTYANLPAKELLYTTRLTDDGVTFRPDLTAAFNDARSHNYGILIEHYDTGGSTYDRTEFSVPNGADDSLLYILTSEIVNKNINADAVTASGEMVDPSITTINNLNLAADVITANAEFVDPSVSSENNITFTDTPWTASAELVNPTILPEMVYVVGHLEASSDIVDPTLDIEGTYIYYSSQPVGTASAEMGAVGWNIGEENVAVHMDASSQMVDPSLRADNLQYANEMNGNSALMTDPTITVVLNSQTINATPMTADAALPNAAYSRQTDVYYTRIRTIAGDADELYIFDGLASDTYGKKPTLNPDQYFGSEGGVFGVTYGEIIPAPGSRKATQLVNSGISYSKNLSGATSVGGPLSAFEMVLRTNTADAGQIYEYKIISGTGGLSEVKGFIRDGKLVFERYSYAAGQAILTGTSSGFKNVADGYWHHIVVNFNDNVSTNTNYYDAYIDGVRDHKRYVGFASATRATRTSIVSNLTADVMSVAYYDLNLTVDQIVKNYYLALDLPYIEVEPMLASAVSPSGNKGRGNTARAIMLYFRDVYDSYDDLDAGGTASSSYLSEWGNYDFGPDVNTDQIGAGWNGAEVFPYPILGPWRDIVTDELRSIDLDTDLDASDFDVVLFRNYPNESSEFDFITGQTQPVPYRDVWTKERETFISNLIKAINKHGLSLYVNDPQLAIDLGIVDKVVSVFDLHDTSSADNGNAAGAGDAWSATIDPFLGTAALAGQGAGPEYFSDTHTLARHRVINTISGITDTLTSKYVWTEGTRYVPYDPFKVTRVSYKYELGALNKDFYPHLVGDAGIYGGPYESQEYGGRGRRNKLIITPPSNVKAGTILTAISPTYYEDAIVTANPYSGYATSIVVSPGQNIGNVQMNAKVYVNFTESMDEVTMLRGFLAQDETKLLNTDLTQDDQEFMWNSANRSWQYSTHRISSFYTSSGAKGDFIKAPPGTGTTTPGYYRVPKSKTTQGNGFVFTASGLYWTESLPLIEQTFNYETYILPAYTPATAAWDWLREKVDITSGDAIIRPTAISATATIVDPQISADITTEIFAAPFTVVATLAHPPAYSVPDVSIVTLPMRAEADIKPSELRVLAEPMTASARTSIQEPVITTTGQEVVLTLNHTDAVLYIKEKI